LIALAVIGLLGLLASWRLPKGRTSSEV
jgi:hypothetical protein